MKFKVRITTEYTLDFPLSANGKVPEWSVLGQDKPLTVEAFIKEFKDHIISDETADIMGYNPELHQIINVEMEKHET